VSCLGFEPSAFMTQTCWVPPGLLEMNAILVPSGEWAGSELPFENVSLLGEPSEVME
jgi:hypothetical protein